MVKRHTRNRKQKRNHHRIMKGGSLSEDEIRQLEDRHFDEFDINTLRELGISFNEIMQVYNTVSINFEGNSDAMIQQVMFDLTNQYKHNNNAKGTNNKTGGKKHRKNRKTRKHIRHNLKGGTCFGTGVGANNYDPNLSIYNTNMLKLFPYKPSN